MYQTLPLHMIFPDFEGKKKPKEVTMLIYIRGLDKKYIVCSEGLKI